MKANEKTIEVISKGLKYLKNLPQDTYFSFSWDGGLHIEGKTQEDVRNIRKAFRGVIWKKEYSEWAQSWSYSATTRTGVNIRIAGVTEGPPQCKMVEEVVMEERSVPTGYTKQMVEVKKVRYICPDGNKANG
jgi:hypothetical protein